MPNTGFFVSCKGVFQGGGCRGVALAGAYHEAHEHGVRFSEVAGTSAGSIVAALIGAGARADQLLELVNELNYPAFLVPPRAMNLERSIGSRIAGFVAQFKHPGFKTFFKHGGMYSSEMIEIWIAEKL